jgi:hypothetical protein
MARADGGSRPAGAGRSGRVALKGASDWRGHAALRVGRPEVLAGECQHAGAILPVYNWDAICGRAAAAGGCQDGGRGGHHPGTQAPEAEEWLVARLGRPRLTWRIGSEQVLSTQTMSKGGPYKVPSQDSPGGLSCQLCTHSASRGGTYHGAFV